MIGSPLSVFRRLIICEFYTNFENEFFFNVLMCASSLVVSTGLMRAQPPLDYRTTCTSGALTCPAHVAYVFT